MHLWDETLAKNLIGCTLLIGLTREVGDSCSYEQFFGVVTHCDPERGITLRLEGSRKGNTYNLPPRICSRFIPPNRENTD
ncbi:hypothetical protein AA0242T_1080 [Acetobacter aceti NRIC 0242]|uniref:Transposase n=1 Tax=Acetobacter aceti NBRC 14818 TaxID=887700 RepID=A0AB33IKJ3_ACEAC|nr:hypothetical protein EDC15_107112 [Acetobacter aceti NBRC 14818]BCK77597.1 hypothetical protein EMQ_3203 [Acetobacter aceti NBRC 14818]GAN56764.1 hypothetical protein Abac_010_038 [Acetobacter aceti NBRC 14818]GBO80378.1 hypothetical protein AA0242T_1080 [Acetobacter aceti NRIC 0242]